MERKRNMKALTVINLPFVERRFEAGAEITEQDFQDYLDAAAKVLPADSVPKLEEVISTFTESGSLSEDMDAELHPDHRAVDPADVPDTMAAIVARAEALVEHLESNGQEVPAKLRALTEISERQINAVDSGQGASSNG
jgi:hypothetical protein